MSPRAAVVLQAVVWGLVGCGPSNEPPNQVTDSGTLPSGGATTGGTTTPTGPYLRCLVQPDNALRFDCDGRVPASGTATAFLEQPSGALRELEVEQTGDEVGFTVWRLRPETSYTVHLTVDGGGEQQAVFETGVVPDPYGLAPTLTGTASFDEILVPFQCDGTSLMALLDTDGTMLWYQAAGETGSAFDVIDGFDADLDGVTAIVGRDTVRRWAWDGTLLLDLQVGSGLPGPVHHDALFRNGHLFVLTAEQIVGDDGNAYVMDGVLVFDAAGSQVAEWSLDDVFEPSGFGAPGGFWGSVFPNAQDWAHTNGIEVDSEGDWLLSSKAFDTVLKVRGDWTEPDFGEVVWAMSASGGPMGNDFAFQGPAPANFLDQHHPNYDAQGRLVLFDNRNPLGGQTSRATVWSVDENAGTTTLDQAWDVDESCPVQGSAFPLGNDHVVATCASSQRVLEFLPGQSDPMWTMEVACASSGSRPLLVRSMPEPLGGL